MQLKDLTLSSLKKLKTLNSVMNTQNYLQRFYAQALSVGSTLKRSVMESGSRVDLINTWKLVRLLFKIITLLSKTTHSSWNSSIWSSISSRVVKMIPRRNCTVTWPSRCLRAFQWEDLMIFSGLSSVSSSCIFSIISLITLMKLRSWS